MHIATCQYPGTVFDYDQSSDACTLYAYKPELQQSKWMGIVTNNNYSYSYLSHIQQQPRHQLFCNKLLTKSWNQNNNSTIYIKNSLTTIKSFASLLDVHSSLFMISFINILWLLSVAKEWACSLVLQYSQFQAWAADRYFSWYLSQPSSSLRDWKW